MLFAYLTFFAFVLFETASPKVIIPTQNKQENSGKYSHKKNERSIAKRSIQEKDWNIFVYIAGNNNLYRFIENSLMQMERIASNNRLNIVCQIDKFGAATTERVEIRKNERKRVWMPVAGEEKNRKNISGTRENFIDFLEWSFSNYTAKHSCVILWNHGAGFIDPVGWGRSISPYRKENFSELSPLTQQDESPDLSLKKGVAFNDLFGTYLTNQDLSFAFEHICTTHPAFTREKNENEPYKKIDIIGMDACCMAGIEVAYQIKDFAQYFISSQDIELGTGWNYTRVLEKAGQQYRTPKELSFDIIEAYEKEYQKIMPDYTLSATNLVGKNNKNTKTFFRQLEQQIGKVGAILQQTLLTKGLDQKLIKILKEIRRRSDLSTSFFDNNYIDIYHFLISLQKELRFVFGYDQQSDLHNKLNKAIKKALTAHQNAIEISVAGPAFKSFNKAKGLSLYFPIFSIHSSYAKTAFGQKNPWYSFLKTFFTLTKR